MIPIENELVVHNYKLQEEVLPKETVRRTPPKKIPEGLAFQELKMTELPKIHHELFYLKAVEIKESIKSSHYKKEPTLPEKVLTRTSKNKNTVI